MGGVGITVGIEFHHEDTKTTKKERESKTAKTELFELRMSARLVLYG